MAISFALEYGIGPIRRRILIVFSGGNCFLGCHLGQSSNRMPWTGGSDLQNGGVPSEHWYSEALFVCNAFTPLNTVDVGNPNIWFEKNEQSLVRISDVRISDVRISDIWAVQFVRSFGYTINFQNPSVRLVESINQTSEIQTVWEWDNFGKRRNPNVRISDVYCIWKCV